MLKHVMIDLETLGTKMDTAFISVGAVRFDPYKGGMDEDNAFYMRVDWQSAIDAGTVTADTIKWWMRQSKEAQTEVLKDGEPLASVLESLSRWLRGPDPVVWSNGATFDVAILEHHFPVAGLKVPWRFWNVRDVRTVVDLAKGIVGREDVPEPDIKHHALQDAIYQAKYVTKICQALR